MFRIRSRIGSGFNQVSGSESGFLYGGLGISKLQFLIKKNFIFSAVNFFPILKPWVLIRIGFQPKYWIWIRNQSDPKHCFCMHDTTLPYVVGGRGVLQISTGTLQSACVSVSHKCRPPFREADTFLLSSMCCIFFGEH